MNKLVKSFLSLALVAVMAILLPACGGGGKESSSKKVEIEYEYEYEYVSKSKTASGEAENDDTEENASKAGTVSGGNSKSSKKTSSKKSSSTTAGTDSAEKYRGTTVRYATWKDPQLNEDGPVVKAFEKKYGITVKVDIIGQTDYINVLTGLIASGDSPDVYFSNNDFPMALSCLQPIDAAKIDKSDSIWDQGMFKFSTINGKTYMVNTVGNIWNELDCLFYNKKLLKDNNITTPEDYYKAGNWTFQTLEKVMTDVKALGSDYIGGYIDWECLLASTGSAYHKWENGKFSNGIDTMLTNVTREISKWYKNGLLRGVADFAFRDDFLNGKCGIAITNAFGLKKTGYWRGMNTDNIGFTYIPQYDKNTKSVRGGLDRGWGIIKGAKNPGAAGVFLRYYLDVNNYNTKSAFISSEAESFYFKLTSGLTTDAKNNYINRGCGLVTGTSQWTLGQIAKQDPTQVAGAIDALKNTINSDVIALNNYIKKQTS